MESARPEIKDGFSFVDKETYDSLQDGSINQGNQSKITQSY